MTSLDGKMMTDHFSTEHSSMLQMLLSPSLDLTRFKAEVSTLGRDEMDQLAHGLEQLTNSLPWVMKFKLFLSLAASLPPSCPSTPQARAELLSASLAISRELVRLQHSRPLHQYGADRGGLSYSTRIRRWSGGG